MYPAPEPSGPGPRFRTMRILLLSLTAWAGFTFLETLHAPIRPGETNVRGHCLASTEADPSRGSSPARTPPPQRTEPSVTVYITTWCPACTMTIDYLKKEGIPFTVKDIEKNRAYMDELVRKTGAYRGVPVLEIDGQTYLGFHPSLLDNLRRK